MTRGPALIETLQALFGAIIFAAAAALYASAIRKNAATVTVLAIFCASVDWLATPAQVPLMLARALFIALLAWVVARYVLNGNPLAWPLTAFLSSVLQTAAVLLQNQRPDLIANGFALIAFAIGAVLWAATPRHPPIHTPTMSPPL